MSRSRRHIRRSFHRQVSQARKEQGGLVDREQVGVEEEDEEEEGGSQCPVPSLLLLPRGHSCSDNLYSARIKSPGRTDARARHSRLLFTSPGFYTSVAYLPLPCVGIPVNRVSNV